LEQVNVEQLLKRLEVSGLQIIRFRDVSTQEYLGKAEASISKLNYVGSVFGHVNLLHARTVPLWKVSKQEANGMTTLSSSNEVRRIVYSNYMVSETFIL